MPETAKHTPGPWGFSPASGEIFHADGVVDPLIATVEADEGIVDASQALADMQLIAASPSLLSAGKSALSFIEACAAQFDFCDNTQRMWADLRAAIAAAEGRS